MNLYDVIPENLFSPLVSKNKGLYSKTLFILLGVFKQQLKIKKDEFVTMIIANLENDIIYADFSEEELLENEHSLSGKAHFLIRKLKQTGWILIETESNFKEYVSVPSYSYRIIQLLKGFTMQTGEENFAYVYSSYSSLKTADETREPFEMVTALYDSFERTEKLVESLKSVYHSITYYNQQLVETLSINNVLRSHYELYQEEIIKRILSPLKIKDSVPKYKIPLTSILKKWLIDNTALEQMVSYLYSSKSEKSVETYRQEVLEKIYYILDTYDNLERDYINVIDEKNNRYTRATTQKIDYLINSDQSIKGNLIQILKAISVPETSASAINHISTAFQIYELSYLNEESLYERKRPSRRTRNAELIMEDDTIELTLKAKANAMQLMDNKYSKQNIEKFVNDILGNSNEVSTKEITINDDYTYIMTLLSVIQARDKGLSYSVTYNNEYIDSGAYRIPYIIYRRKEQK